MTRQRPYRSSRKSTTPTESTSHSQRGIRSGGLLGGSHASLRPGGLGLLERVAVLGALDLAALEVGTCLLEVAVVGHLGVLGQDRDPVVRDRQEAGVASGDPGLVVR